MGGYLILIVLAFALMWFLLIRPQRRRQVLQQQMLARLEVGDEILTAGGLYGRITALGDDDVTLEIAPGTTVRLDRRAVAARVTPEGEEEHDAEPGEIEQVSSDES